MEQLTIKQAMSELNVRSRQTIYNLVLRGRLTKHQNKHGYGRGGRRIWFDADQVRSLNPDWNWRQALALIESGEPAGRMDMPPTEVLKTPPSEPATNPPRVGNSQRDEAGGAQASERTV